MSAINAGHVTVHSVYRYPVKSMLGERLPELWVDEEGALGDRRLALIDDATGRIASAKQARLWRNLLHCSASLGPSGVTIEMPGSGGIPATAASINAQLSQLLGRPVHLIDRRPVGATIERADPDQVLDRGLDAEVDAPLLELAKATSGHSFTDFAPLHAITTATLDHIDADAARYRPNIVIATPPDFPVYAENDWTGCILRIGDAELRVMGPTPRCAIPTLEHGSLPKAPHALRLLAAENRVNAFDFGVLACAGTYLQVVTAGMIRSGERVHIE